MERLKISPFYQQDADVVLYEGDCRELIKQIPAVTVKLIVTSPPYNIGKPYEKRLALDQYLEQQKEVISKCVEVLHEEREHLLASGQLCFQKFNSAA